MFHDLLSFFLYGFLSTNKLLSLIYASLSTLYFKLPVVASAVITCSSQLSVLLLQHLVYFFTSSVTFKDLWERLIHK